MSNTLLELVINNRIKGARNWYTFRKKYRQLKDRWKTKNVNTFKASSPYPPSLELVYPDLKG